MDFTQLKAFMNKLTEWRIPGNDISVWLDNKEVFRYQSGYMDVENKIPMSDSCLINIYSCSKVATVTAGMQLLERGEITLDTPLYDFIPEYKEVCVRESDGNLRRARNPITIRHLFTMTAGMTYSMTADVSNEARETTDGKFNTVEVAKLISMTLKDFEKNQDEVRARVAALCKKYPLYE